VNSVNSAAPRATQLSFHRMDSEEAIGIVLFGVLIAVVVVIGGVFL
jgi:hypothetical protein